MKKHSKLTESNQRIYDFLHKHPVGVLATTDSQGVPHGATIYFDVDKDFIITFTTKTGTKKNTNVAQNPRVSLVAFESKSQTTVEVIGTVLNINDTPKAQEAFDYMLQASLATSEAGIPPIEKLHAGDFVAYKIVPNEIKMAVYIRPDSGGYDMFETIYF